MELVSCLSLIVVVLGIVVALYGGRILVTGRATRGDKRAFRQLADAGRYYLCFGFALALITSGSVLSRHAETALAIAADVIAVVLMGFVIRYRPRSKRQR